MKHKALFSALGLAVILAAACSSPTAPRLPPGEDPDPKKEPPAGGFTALEAQPILFELLS
jgi:hypothetical protein